jgi:hypothetical protein
MPEAAAPNKDLDTGGRTAMEKKPRNWMVIALGLVTPMAFSCGASQPAATAPAPSAAAVPASSAVPAPAAAPAPVATASATPAASTSAAPAAKPAWKDMKAEQRKEYMKTVVVPKMKEEFVAFNAHAYGEMNCATCHGEGAKDGSFKMPNPKLPKLPGDEAGFKALMKKKPEVMKFMSGKVVPAMAEMVGESPYNPETKQGFGCFECHTKK